MRIIGGTHRSRPILPPRFDRTRPITDRVKQSVFDRLVAMEALGGFVLDLFSGTGSLGLEALSRGGDHCTFVEKDRSAREILEENLVELGFKAQAAVLSVDALSLGWLMTLPHRPIRLVFCDPPYKLAEDEKQMERIASLIGGLLGVMEEDGVLVLRTPERTKVPIVEGWNGPETHEYGSMAVHFYQKPGEGGKQGESDEAT